MSKFTKTIAGFAGSVALIASLAGSVSAVTFGTNLTVGSRGDDVSSLQAWLVSKGYLVMPAGVSYGYFGTLTRSAVAAYQTAKGISPTAGYFGPITRAAVNADQGVGGGASVPLCPNGMTLASNCTLSPSAQATGALCPNGNTLASNCSLAPSAQAGPTPGCPVGAVYNSTNGTLCPTTPTPTTGAICPAVIEGSITTKLAPSPAANADVRSQIDVPVYGIEAKAISSGMKVDRLDLQVAVTPVGSSAQNPGTFINNIKIWDGTTLLRSINVSTADFVKDSSDRYHIIISGIGFDVPVNTSKTLTVSVSSGSISSSDVNRTVAVQGYAGNANNVRATDCAGLQSYTDMSGSANTRTHTFKPAGASTVTLSINSASTPDATNHRVSSTNGVQKLTMLAFNVKSETGSSVLRKLYVQTNATATPGLPSTLFLYELGGSTILASVSAASANGGMALFTDLSIPIAQDQTKSFVIKTDSPATVAGGAASTTLPVNALQWEKPDGSVASTSNTGAIVSSDQYFYGAVSKWTLVSVTTSAPSTIGTSPATTTVTYTMKLRATADGGSMVKPVLADFVLRFASSTATSTQTGYWTGNSTSTSNGDNVSGSLTTVVPSDDTVGDGGTYDVTLTGLLRNRNSQGVNTINGNYFMVLTSASSSVGGNTIVQTWGLDDFKTDAANLPN